ncbi:phosphatidylinositol 3-kinase catalytic subunit type 3 [Penaeus vannamei]|uniref:phosphatidylinositol 3-kinase catalytic subunit type 3 n=1 Tax=Penaeus vannamei TaxID=6689 RepID=UPI000F663C3A|nr:phosphatidylinositol 3-kinase catalytic subunit type 3-like [Penaeus vannamei]
MEPDTDKFWYVRSCDLDAEIQVKIGNLDGKRDNPNYEALLKDSLLKYSGLYQAGCSDLYVTCQVICDGRQLTLPVRTSYKSFSARWSWNEWLTLPLKFRDLPRNALLALTVYDSLGPRRIERVGGTTISFFGKQGVFRQGLHDLRLWPGRVGDETTPGKGHDRGKDQMVRLAKLAKKHRNGQMMKVDWLDRLTFREIEVINEHEKRSSNAMYLMVEFPRVEHEGVIYSVVWWERGGEVEYRHRSAGSVVRMPDPEIGLENLQEAKHHRLARSLRSGVTDRDLKPNLAIRDALHTIVDYPPTKQLTSDEQDTVWKYRFYLSSQKRALTKFLKCVNWKLTGEAKQAIELLNRWAPPDADDALELLGPGFTHPEVRRYAVKRLSHASDEDLLLYLLQLVQALKYEAIEGVDTSLCDVSHYDENEEQEEEDDDEEEEGMMKGEEAKEEKKIGKRPQEQGGRGLLGEEMDKDEDDDESEESESDTATLKQSGSSSLLADVEGGGVEKVEDRGSEKGEKGMTTTTSNDSDQDPKTDSMETQKISPTTPNQTQDSNQLRDPKLIASMDIDPKGLDLASFLIQRATKNPTLANYLYWYLIVECERDEPGLKHEAKVVEMYEWVVRRFRAALWAGGRAARATRRDLARQTHFLEQLVALVKVVAKESNRVRRIEKLQSLLADPAAFKVNFSAFNPLRLPLDPEVIVTGIVPEKATLFKSALEPSRLTFVDVEGKEYVAIFKHGDDLRQDQLIIQMLTLMDRLLRRENLDLRLTPYKVLATSSRHGFVQFVESLSVAEVLRTEGSILNFFRRHAPSETGPQGISSEVMECYIKSCAGYCVMTYLLGVGDRHLDNLLLTKDGNLFHIDFGYILGRDPKPLPPPMKLSKEMVEGMGGQQAESYHEFRRLCYTAFHQLRRHANLILNLFSLMVDANVPDIALENDKAVKKVEDKFRLDLSDEEGASFVQGLIDDSVNAVVAVVVEQLHKFAQYIRK